MLAILVLKKNTFLGFLAKAGTTLHSYTEYFYCPTC